MQQDGRHRPKSFHGNISDIDIRLLRVFREVVRSRGFTGAELVLGAGKSTISKHIADLEDRLGVRLCRRGRSGFALTLEGQKIYNATLDLFSSLEDFRANVNAVHGRLEGRLSVGAADTTLIYDQSALTTAMAAFRRNAPSVHLHLAVNVTSDVERRMLDGTYDIGILASRSPHRSLVCHPLSHERSLLYCGRGHPFFAASHEIDQAAIRDAAFAVRGGSAEEREFVMQAVLTPAATADDSDSVAALILTGEYIGFLPERFAWPLEQRAGIRAIQPDAFVYGIDITAVTRRGVPAAPSVERFLAELVRASSPAVRGAAAVNSHHKKAPISACQRPEAAA